LLQSVDEHYLQHGVLVSCQRIGFDVDSMDISLDVPAAGIVLEGWKVLPLTSPLVVRRM